MAGFPPASDVFEVFAQLGGSGRPIQHVGSVRGTDPHLAWQAAKEAYARREDCSLLWVAPRSAFVINGPEDSIVLRSGSSRRYRMPKYPSAHRRARAKDTNGADETESE